MCPLHYNCDTINTIENTANLCNGISNYKVNCTPIPVTNQNKVKTVTPDRFHRQQFETLQESLGAYKIVCIYNLNVTGINKIGYDEDFFPLHLKFYLLDICPVTIYNGSSSSYFQLVYKSRVTRFLGSSDRSVSESRGIGIELTELRINWDREEPMYAQDRPTLYSEIDRLYCKRSPT